MILTRAPGVTLSVRDGQRVEVDIFRADSLVNLVVRETLRSRSAIRRADKMSVEGHLIAMGLTLPPTGGETIANIVKTVQVGSILYVSGHGPVGPDGIKHLGHLGSEVTVSQGYAAARLSALGCLSSVKAAVGSLDRIARIVKILVFVSSAPGFNEQPLVANGASDLLVRVFGERGVHGRSAIGVAELPLNMAVEIEMIVELTDEDDGAE